MKSEESQLADIRDKIWTTEKCRINAETRFRYYNAVAHILTAYFSLWLIILSVLNEYLSQRVEYFDKITLAFSIIVFALTLSLYGFRFSDRANLHRECYLKLHRLLLSRSDAHTVGQAYIDILEGFPNHSNRDYEDLVIARGFFGDDPVKAPGTGTIVTPSWFILLKYFLRRFTFWLSVAIFAAAPIVWLFMISCSCL